VTDEHILRALTDPRDDDTQAAIEKLAELAGDGTPADIPEVLRRLDAIEEHMCGTSQRGEQDGIASFTRLYRDITAEIGRRADEGGFMAPGRFLVQLDVQFAERYFEAVRTYARNEGNTPRCWQVLFALRQVPGIPMANFAAAGVNAHINYDLSPALLRTWALGPPITAEHRRDQQRDYDMVNEVFAARMDGLREEMQTWISQGRDGSVPDRLANWIADIVVRWTRQVAWDVATDLWHPDDCGDAVARSDERLGGIAGDLGAVILRVPLPF
jgi:hypothetical protein